MVKIEVCEGGVLIAVKVVPGSSRDRLLGEWDGRAKVAVAAPPQEGRANRAVEKLIAKRLGVRARMVSVVRGKTSPLKTVKIDGGSVEAVRAALSPP